MINALHLIWIIPLAACFGFMIAAILAAERGNSMKNTLTFLWCFPQNLIGFLVMLFTRAERVGDHYHYNFKGGSVSLGEFIFLAPYDWGDERVLKHEKGHREQSKRLGWLYLLVIGLPSVIWQSCFRQYRIKHKINYYDFYTEKWADRLGGVEKGKGTK